MNLRSPGPIFLLTVLFCTAGVGHAELTRGQQLAAEALVKQFSSKRFAVRQQAVGRLVALGPDVVPLVKKALAETDDNEVKLRCRMVLKQIAEKHGLTIDLETPGQADVPAFAASTVTINVTDRPLSEVLQLLAEESGNAPLDADEKSRDKLVTLSAKDMPYWECLDRISRKVALIYASDRPGDRLRLQTIPGARDVGVCVGPVAVKVLRAHSSRRFRTSRTPMVPGRPEGSGVFYELVYWWEDRLPVVASYGRVKRATSAGGREWVLAGEAKSTRRGGTIPVFLKRSPGLGREVTLEGEVTLVLAVGERVARLQNVLAGKGKTITAGGVLLKVADTTREAETVTLALKPRAADRKTLLPTFDNHRRYGFFLEDAQGGRFPAEVTRRPPADDAYVLRFQNLRGDKLIWSLVYASPQRRVDKTQPFRMTGVPVP